jgi:hypothetical protein
MHKNAWTVLGDENRLAVSKYSNRLVPTIGSVLCRSGEWVIEGDNQTRAFTTHFEAIDTLLLSSPR